MQRGTGSPGVTVGCFSPPFCLLLNPTSASKRTGERRSLPVSHKDGPRRLVAGFVVALVWMIADGSALFAQEAAKPGTATEPASGLAYREGGRQILIGKEGGIFFVAAQQAVRNEVGLDNASSIKVHSLIEQYCHEQKQSGRSIRPPRDRKTTGNVARRARKTIYRKNSPDQKG